MTPETFISLKKRTKRPAFTLIELLVVIAIVALLLSIIVPAIKRAKESGKRAVCLNNTKSLALGWTLYADNHDGSLPNPSAFTPAGWVKNVQNPYEYTPVEAPIEMQLEAIRNGVLFPYIESTDVYRCPVAQKNEMRTYSCSPTLGTEGFEGWPYVLKNSEIRSSGTRLVFLDDYGQNWDAQWYVWYDQPRWWNPIPARHGKGTVASFADVHAEWWDWQDQRTIDWASLDWQDAENAKNGPETLQPGNEDLRRIQTAVFGGIGYDF